MSHSMRTLVAMILMSVFCVAEAEFGTWRMNPARSTLPGESHPKSFTVRIEPDTKGEVFTLEWIDGDGRSTTSSTILYLDSRPRDFQGFGCTGTQWSRRLDRQIVEILRTCDSGESTRFIRRLFTQSKELILEITKEQPGRQRFEQRLVLEKQ
jgi:hypothetical protein